MKIQKFFLTPKYIIYLIAIFIIGCSNNGKDPISPFSEQNNKTSIENDINREHLSLQSHQVGINQMSNDKLEKELSRNEVDTSSEGSQQLGGFLCHYFNGIRDITQPGGIPTMKFRAFSKTTDWGGIPVDIENISVEINVRWQYLGASGWHTLWKEKDFRENSCLAQVGWKSFFKKSPWTAQSYSMHEFKDGSDWGGIYNPPIEWTAYFVERKM